MPAAAAPRSACALVRRTDPAASDHGQRPARGRHSRHAREVDEEWRRATEGKRTARREILARDRNNPGRYLAIVFFDSAESAAQNSNLPETQAAAEKYMALSAGPPVFSDLDVLEDRA